MLLPWRRTVATDRATGQRRAADLDIAALADQQNLVKTDRRALVTLDLFEAQDITFGRAVLFAAAAKNRIHRILLRIVSRVDHATH